MGKLKLYGTRRPPSLPAAGDGVHVDTPEVGALGWPWRAAALLALLLGAGVLALVVAHWGWRWFGPAERMVAPGTSTTPSIDAIIAAAPFGRASQPEVAAVAAAAGAPRSGGLAADAKLLGVFAGKDGSGYALLRLPERGPMLVHSGEDISPGVRLDAVNKGGITISEQGSKRDIPLRPEGSSVSTPATASAGATPSAAAGVPLSTGNRMAQRAAMRGEDPACRAPQGFTGPIYRLNAELLTGMAAQPQSWSALLAPDSGALVVRDETGLATMLGMKAKDRLQQANGIPLNAVNDVLTAIVKPLTASQVVRLTGMRDGKPREWLFLNASTCPGS